MIPRGDGSDGTFNPDLSMEPKEQRKVDDFIIFAMGAADEALADSGWQPKTEEDRYATGVLIGSGIGGIGGIVEAGITLHERGPAAHLAVLHSRAPDQPRLRLCVDQARPEGAEPRRRHRLLDRRACDRRRVAADRARRRRRDGGGRH